MYEKWLKAFHMVASQSSFTHAAKALNVGQPTISAHIKTLEDYFKENAQKLEIKIVLTENSTVINNDNDPTRRLQKLASKYEIPSVVIGP